jgi:hypothetical protein
MPPVGTQIPSKNQDIDSTGHILFFFCSFHKKTIFKKMPKEGVFLCFVDRAMHLFLAVYYFMLPLLHVSTQLFHAR